MTLDPETWLLLARKAEASVHRYASRCPPWLELQELKAQIVAKIPDLLDSRPDHMEVGYYIYCRASFEARRILSRQRTQPKELTDTGYYHQQFDTVDVTDELKESLGCLSPLERQVILLHYAGRSNKRIASYLGRDATHVQLALTRAKYKLGITAEPHDDQTRMAA
jgi:DNA-directed RNA polymerase specialized sigma24 family protein